MAISIVLILILISKSLSLNVAIIGAGIGGSSTAYFLRNLINKDLNIDVYEAVSVGGRLNTISYKDHFYENGGSIIHSRNKYAASFVKKFGLSMIEEECPNKIAIFNGTFVFESSSYTIINAFKLFYRYGLDIYYLKDYVDNMISSFERIYVAQDNGEAFNSVQDLLNRMNPNFPKLLKISTADGFSKEKFSKLLIDEIIGSSIRCNYGQTTKIHQFVGSVSVAGAGYDLWSVKGGNKKIVENLIDVSDVHLILERVISVEKCNSDSVLIRTKSQSKYYDYVVVATPFILESGLNFFNFSSQNYDYEEFHHTYCTFIDGVINPSFFGTNNTYDSILTFKDDIFFNSLSITYPVDGACKKDTGIHKIFSKKKLKTSELSHLFKNYSIISETDWLAYPHYSYNNITKTFSLYDRVYYVNAIESAASSIEMSAVAARNVAILLFKHFSQKADQDSKNENAHSHEEF